MAMPGSRTCIAPALSAKSPAWPMSDASSPACTRRKLWQAYHVLRGSRRKFARVYKAQGPAAAFEAIRRITDRYAVETVARGLPPNQRAGIRQAGARPVFNGLEARLNAQPPDISGKNPLASAIRHALTRRARIRPDLDHGILEIDNNTAERAIRAVALGRKNDLFVGSQTGGKSAAIVGTLIETAKLNGVARGDPADHHGQPYRVSWTLLSV